MNNLILVKESVIHGKGIFAAQFIPKGTLILIIEGDVIDENECMRREDEEDNVYIFWNGDNYIDTSNSTDIKYINHSCDNNCEVLDNDEKSLQLVAARDILPEEELTIDYGYEEIYEYCTCVNCKSEKQSA